jgi:glucose/arabinose dehydrogenase
MTSVPRIGDGREAGILRGSLCNIGTPFSLCMLRRVGFSIALCMLGACGGGGGSGGDNNVGGGGDEEPPPSAGSIRLEAAFGGRTFEAPVFLLQAPGDQSRWYVVEQAGRVLDFAESDSTTVSTFVDLRSQVESDGEKGLLGMAFHPQYAANGRVYLSYTHRNTAGTLISRVSRFTTIAAPNGRREIDPASETFLLTVSQPFDNHNGGHIAFGPDGYLYIGFGDGGGGGDPQGNAQRLDTVLGKLLRIDVNGIPYSIPPDNPFAGNALCSQGIGSGACPEIYAYGLRNPWRWSFDRANGTLWLADVGQNAWEEVNVIERGGNYGWNCREGAHEFPGGRCTGGNLIDPVSEYAHTNGNFSITGGYVYRGSQSTALVGRYLFGDFGSGRIWTAVPGTLVPRELLDTSANIASFGESNTGELYVVDLNGAISSIVFE